MLKLFKWFVSLFKKAHFPGGLLDPRPQIEKDKDYQAVEIVKLVPPLWREKPESEWRRFPVRDQNGSGTCVAQTCAKILGIENNNEQGVFVDFSARDIYERRADKTQAGMWGPDALNIMSKYGATTEVSLPSQRMSESDITAPFGRSPYDIATALKFKAGGYVQLPVDIDAVAAIIDKQKKGVMLFNFFEFGEWLDVPVVKNTLLQERDSTALRHSVTAVDNFIWNGKKCLLIEDSWGEFGQWKGQRVITEDWFKTRVYFAGYVLDLSNEWQTVPQKPKYKFTETLRFGETNDDIVKLQDVLKYEQMFPQKTESTGLYLHLTAKGVMAFQRKYKVVSEAEIAALGGKIVGPKTLSTLNKLYS